MTRTVWKALAVLAVTTAGIPAYAELNNEYTAQGGAWQTYRKNCSGCHGFTGQGIFPAGTPLMSNPFLVNSPAGAVKTVIRNGRRGKDKAYPMYLRAEGGYMNMPPFGNNIISDRELDVLVSYLKGGFQKGQFNQP